MSRPNYHIQQGCDTTRCIHTGLLAEGYRAEDMPTFFTDVHTAVEGHLCHEPFKSMRQRFNMCGEAESVDSGASEPGKGIWRNTALHSPLGHQLQPSAIITTSHLKDMHDLLDGIPYEHILVWSTLTVTAAVAFPTPISYRRSATSVETCSGA